MNIEMEDKRRRKKRSSDDDSNDNFPSFDFTSFPSSVFNEGFIGSNSEFPPTRAFQTILARTQMSDQLPELPGVLGLQSEHQIPGSGIPDANIQNGGLATNMPTFGTTTNFEQPDSDTNNQFGNTDSNNGDTPNTDSSDNPDTNPLLTAVKDVAATIESGNFLPEPSPTEALDLLKQNDDTINQDNSDSTGTTDTPDNTFASGTTVGPPTTVDTNGQDDSNNDKVDDIPKVGTEELKDTLASNIQTNDKDDTSKSEGPEVKTADVTPPSMGVISPETNVETNLPESNFGDVIDDSKLLTETLTDSINTGGTETDSKDDTSVPSSLGFGGLTDMLTDTAFNEGLNLNNMKDNIDDVKDIVDDLHQDQGTILNDDRPFIETITPDNIDKTIENIDVLSKVDDINENFADKMSEIVNLPSDNKDIESLKEQVDDMNMNDGSEHLKDILDNIVTETPPVHVVSDFDVPEIDQVISDEGAEELIPEETNFDIKLDNQEPIENELSDIDVLGNGDDVKDIVSDTSNIPEADIPSLADEINDQVSELANQAENSDFDEEIVQDFDEGKGIAPEADVEPMKTDYLDDMSERLKVSDGVKDDDIDILENVQATDPLESLKDAYDDLPDSQFGTDTDRNIDTDTEISTDGTENADEMTDISVDDRQDDGQTKRDFDWSELDRSNNDQETVNDNDVPEVDIYDDYYDAASSLKPIQDDIDRDIGESTDHIESLDDQNSDIFEQNFEAVDDKNEVLENHDTGDDSFDGIENEHEDNTHTHDVNDHDAVDGNNDDMDDILDGSENVADIDTVTEIPDTFFEDKEEHDHFDEIPDLAEDVVEDDRKTALNPVVESKEMNLASCEMKLPSVCFSYEVEVMDKGK